MKAEELRIGNYVNENYGGIYEVININSEGFNYLDLRKPTFKAIGRYDMSTINGIPLTEEILLKCGFSRHHTNYFNDVIYIKNVVEKDSFDWGVFPKELGSGFIIKNSNKLKHLHQLQNIYFAITNEELQINL